MGYFTNLYNYMPVYFQSLIISLYGFKIRYQRNGDEFNSLLKLMMKLQYASRADIRNYQIEKLKSIVKHASIHVPFYSEFMKKNKIHYSDIKNLDDIKWFPIVDKGMMKANPLKFCSTKRIIVDHGHTSGTTGTPFNVIYSRNTSIAMAACDWRHMLNCGRQRSDLIAIFLGRVIVPLKNIAPPFWRYNYIHNEIWFSSFHMSDKNMEHYVEHLKKMKVRFIKAYPSTAYILAKYCLSNGLACPMNGVFTSSETLFDHQKSCIEEAFQCSIFDYYGHAERAIFATECSSHDGLHINEDFGIVECLDENGIDTEIGKEGALIGTSLYNYAMPFIRYNTGDKSYLKYELCSCGRSFVRMGSVKTKSEDIIVTPDGRKISPSVLTHPFKPINTILESQIIQEKLDEIVVMLVVSDDFTPEHEKSLRIGLQDRLGASVNINFVKTDLIKKSQGGKFRWVVSNVGSSSCESTLN